MPAAHHTPSPQRVFLGWDRPLLHLAAERLSGMLSCPPSSVLPDISPASADLPATFEHRPSNIGNSLLDLSGTVVVVPTSHSGRRLRERLAWLAEQHGGGVLPPEVCTPERLLRRFFPRGAVEPSPADRTALWAALLRDAGQEERGALIPGGAQGEVGIPATDETAGGPGDVPDGSGPAIEIGPLLTAGQRISQVQHLLGEAGLSMADVADPDGPFLVHLDEPARWISLGRLERRFDELMARHGLSDSNRMRRDAARNALPPPGWNRVVLLGVLDPLPLAIELLARLAASLSVEVWIHAPAGLSESFDGWGRPLPEAWASGRLEVDEGSIRLVADCAQAASVAAQVCLNTPGQAEQTALCVPAGDEIPIVVKELERAGLTAFDPGGRPLRLHRVVGLLELLWGLLPEPSAEAVAGLLRHPDYGGIGGPGFGVGEGRAPDMGEAAGPTRHPGCVGRVESSTSHGAGLAAPSTSHGAGLADRLRGLLRALDELRAEHLPTTLADIERVVETDSPLAHACAGIRAHVGRLRGDSPGSSNAPAPELPPSSRRGPADSPATIAHRTSDIGRASLELLAEVYRGRVLRPADPDDRVFTVAARALADLLTELDEGVAARLLPDPADRLALARLQLSSLSFQPERDPGAVDILGWLELPFEDAPNLVVCGMNDGAVPETVTADPFLPDSLRKRLGLRTNDDRMARDAALLAAVAQSRKSGGRLDLLVEKTSPQGDPKRPSRLLFLCPDALLPGRVLRLFGEVELPSRPVPRTSPWKLAPRIAPAPQRLRVTSFSSWLACPFRFYLTGVLGMESVDDRSEEMDPMGFGSLIHEALQALGDHRLIRVSTDVEAVRDFLRGTVVGLARDRFGKTFSPALVAQVEAASQRLCAAAAVHVQSVLEGWRIHAVEKRLDVALTLRDAPATMADLGVLPPSASSSTIDHPPSTIRLTGRIDRIDRHEKTGKYRILDYKTGDSGPRPEQTHFGPAREGTVPEALVEVEGREKAWTDLQLPLYRALLADELGHDAEVGYFLLPKAVSETRIELWTGLSPELMKPALACARGVASRIFNQEFWPPASPSAAIEELYGASAADLDMEQLERLLGREP